MFMPSAVAKMDCVHFREDAAAGFSRGGMLGSLRLLSHTVSRKVSFVTRMSSQMTD